MQLKEGTKVVTADGDKVGTIDRIVIDPVTKEVTHLVVRKGFLFTEDKVVPMSLVGPATADQVTLRPGAGELDKLPDFQETQYVPIDRESPTRPAPEQISPFLYFYPPRGSAWRLGEFTATPIPPYVVETTENIPEGTVALEEGAKVVTSDGAHVGDVERVYTDPQVDRATHLLISKGLILKEKKLIPTSWITSIREDEVHLAVDADVVENLPEYGVQD